MEQLAMFQMPAGPAVAERRSRQRVEEEAWQIQPQLPIAHPDHESLYTWSDSAIATLRESLLYASFRDICDNRTSKRTREEIWRWIERDEKSPFSFRVCVTAIDPAIDAATLRYAIRALSERVLATPEGLDVADVMLTEIMASAA